MGWMSSKLKYEQELEICQELKFANICSQRLVNLIGGFLRSQFNCVELIISDMGPVIGVHAGPGPLGLVIYTADGE